MSIVLACRACGAELTHALRELAADTWPAREVWRVSTNGDLVDERVALRWVNELWNEDSTWLPFPTDAWVIAPISMLVEGFVVGPPGCCGWAPHGSDRNQCCRICRELVGWHNTDCLMPQFIAFAPDAVDVR
jgi:hypothetical protein